MNSKIVSPALSFMMIFFIGVMIPNTGCSQNLLKKAKKEISKISTKPKPQKTSNSSSSRTTNSKSNTSSTGNSSKKTNDGRYQGRAAWAHRTATQRLEMLQECSINKNSEDCSLANRARSLELVKESIDTFAEKDPEYDISEFQLGYDKHKQEFDADAEAYKASVVPVEMKTYNTSSSVYGKVRFSDVEVSGSNLEKLKFFVTLIRNDDGFEWKKQVNYDQTNPDETYIASLYREFDPTGKMLTDEKDRIGFYIYPPEEGKLYGTLRTVGNYLKPTSGIILFGDQSQEELRSELDGMKFTSTNEEAERTSLEKNHVGEIIFSPVDLSRTLDPSKLQNTFIIGNPIYTRVVLADPKNSMRELFIKDGHPFPRYMNSRVKLEYYKDGTLIGTYESNKFVKDLYDMYDSWRSFREPLKKINNGKNKDNGIQSNAAPFWEGLLTSGELKNGTYTIDMKYYVVHEPGGGEQETWENKGRIYEKKISEGSFELVVTDAGIAKLCAQTDYKMPKPKVRDANLEGKMLSAIRELAKNDNWKETPLKVIINSDKWIAVNNRVTGAYEYSIRDGIVISKMPDGRTRAQTFGFKKDKNGNVFYDSVGGSPRYICMRCK
nr:hypothetical protein [Allomuricauda sp.]